MRQFDLLIFDWDGTLADSEALIVGSMQGAIGTLNLPIRSDQQIRELIGLGLNEALQSLYPEFNLEELQGLLADYKRRFISAAPTEAPLFPGAMDTLRNLHREGYTLAIATGKSRRGLDRSLDQHAGLRPLISSSRCADETASKPDPKMLRELLEKESVPVKRALMIGDTDYDLIMARSIGMLAVAVASGVHDAERLRQAGAPEILRDVTQLFGWLGHSPGVD